MGLDHLKFSSFFETFIFFTFPRLFYLSGPPPFCQNFKRSCYNKHFPDAINQIQPFTQNKEVLPQLERTDADNYIKAMGDFIVTRFGEDKFLEILPWGRFESDFPGMKKHCGALPNKHVLFMVLRILKKLSPKLNLETIDLRKVVNLLTELV